MMTEPEKVNVEFTVKDRAAFDYWLQVVTDMQRGVIIPSCPVIGYRADDYVHRREALSKFVDQMEVKLRQNEHKTTWRDQPIEALIRLMYLEIEEFKVADEFFTITEARNELVDVANFSLICWDRLGMLIQDRNRMEQSKNAKT